MTIVACGADHAGVDLKNQIGEHLVAMGHEVVDLGTNGSESVDYPDFGVLVGEAVVTGRAELGIAVCGSGIGIAMAAGKVSGVRAATVHDVTSATLARQHNDANVLCLGARFVGTQTALDSVVAFLGAAFEGGRHVRRVEKINALDPVLDDTA